MENKRLQPPVRISVYQTYLHPEFALVELPDAESECQNTEQLFSFFDYVNADSASMLRFTPFEEMPETALFCDDNFDLQTNSELELEQQYPPQHLRANSSKRQSLQMVDLQQVQQQQQIQ